MSRILNDYLWILMKGFFKIFFQWQYTFCFIKKKDLYWILNISLNFVWDDIVYSSGFVVYICVCVCVCCCCLVTKSCQTFCDPMDCSMPDFPVHHYLPEFTETHVHWVGVYIYIDTHICIVFIHSFIRFHWIIFLYFLTAHWAFLKQLFWII